MNRNRQVNKVVHFLLTLLIMFAVSIAPAQALLKSGTWQELNSTTGAVNGTAPLADGATIPLYQGSMLLDPTKTYDIEFTAMPRDFSADASSTSMRAVNSTDTEGDLFTDPPSIAWENQEPPTMSLVWADAATPDTPLSPQPILNQTFCAQNLAGRQLVAWAQVEDENSVPALWLYTRTGVPNSAVISLLSPKVTLNIKPAVSDPVSVSGDHIDANFAASKVKAGESITLTVSTKACNGDVAPNAAFVIRREDAINRQGVVNNANPVRVGDTELTTTQTEYHGVTDEQGNATVVVTQEQGPGVKTRLIVSSQSYPTLTDNVDVIFTTITSPDSDKANMYGHMLENATATLNGTTYTFTRPKLAAETSGNGGTVVDSNETWAQFTWSGADNHCDILPDAEQLVALRHEHSALATYTGWPVTGDAEYWSSTKDQINDYHAAVHMNSASVVRAANSDTLLVSCVDKAQPAAHPQITLSPEGPYKAQVGESIDLVMTVVDRDTQKPLPYRYMELFIDPAKNRKGEHQDAWDNQRVTINTEDMRASSPEHYTGVTDANVSIYASCLASDNPAAASITIEPVDASQWYDGSGVHAVKAKKGDTMQLKVTVKDASGNPIPEAPFVLTRGDGYDRKGEKYTASEGDDLQGIVTPVVIDGESLAWTTTKMGMLTGADGTRIISVTRPDTHGTRTAIIATLYENAAVSASIDTIFTVITSPDVDVARMWGHMLPSLTAADGAEYQRPQLYAELANQASAAQYTEDNEIWAGLYGPGSSKTDPAVNCAAGYFPSIEALDSLYSKYPNRTIKTAQGWPINRSYWSGSSSWSLTGGKPRSYYTVDLDDDSRRSVVNDGVNDRQYQICATTPKTQATQSTLTSTLATDDTIQAVKAKNSESIPLLVTTTDAAGNPVPYTTFSLKRDAGTPRKADYPFTNSYTMTMTQSGGATQEFAYSSSVLYGATGANGTLALSLDEPGGVGVKSVVTASLYDAPTVTSSLPAVFTVITSPNSDRANMYGHMPETFTASNGAKFTRPLLYGELSSQNHTSSYFETNETWFTVNNFNTGNYGACPINQMATQDDLQSLYRDHPKGKITTDIGLPIKKKWWAGDSLVKNQSIYWQFTDLNTGNGGTTLETPGNFYYQLCLTEPRQMKIALSTDVWNADKSAAVAKTGEAIPMTVTVTNGAGQPQAGATVMLTRDYSYSRGTVDSKYIQAGVIGEPVVSKGALSDMTLTPVSPAGAAVVFNNQRGTSTKWYGVTGDDGKLRFTLNQDKSLGLRTSITATLSELAGETASVDAIFTVPTSPDTPYASYWGHMPDTVEVNGVTLRRPFLKTEMSKMPPGTWPLNNETWAANYIDYGETSIHATTSLPYLCGSLENAATLDDLKALKNIIGDLHWPTAAPASSYTYDYASQTMVGGKYCSFNETTNTENCTLSSQGFAYASCRVQ
ncbi:hypothetical protein FDO45_15590 [Salmonella enterica subsp. enterica serovar Javiana]|nr:hypothetical protein [Salmonella enterica subsp. enterica serovar Javiana]EGM7025817.1 hypothetical protein [Salmonella enterica subsp. enterica serovar Javiana]